MVNAMKSGQLYIHKNDPQLASKTSTSIYTYI